MERNIKYINAILLLIKKSGISIGLYIVASALLVSCDNGQNDMQAFSQHFKNLANKRQKMSQTDRLVNSLRGTEDFHIVHVAWCGNNRTIITGGGHDTSLLMWDIEDGKSYRTIGGALGSSSISCSDNGRFLASANSIINQPSALKIWDLDNPEGVIDITGPFPLLNGKNDSFGLYLTFNQQSSRLYAHYMNRKRQQRLITYDTKSWEIVNDFRLQGRRNTKPALNDQKKIYAYGLDNRSVSVINILNGAKIINITTEKLYPSVISFGKGGETIFIGCKRLYDAPHTGLSEQVIEEYSLSDGSILQTIVTGHIFDLTAIIFQQKTMTLITASSDKTIEIRNANTGKLIDTLGDKTNQIYSMDVSSDGKHLVTAGGVINIWSLLQ